MEINQNKRNISRRHFLGLAGGAVGMAALASMGIYSGWAENISELDPEKMIMRNIRLMYWLLAAAWLAYLQP